MKRFIFLVLSLTFVQLSGSTPLVIGHRGAPGHRPENTLASYDRAIFFGADYVEADIVSTKDHVLVASHNPDITHTTDVLDHPEFASRYAVKNVSGETYEGFFVDDFTVAELKSLRTRERYQFRNQSWNDMFSIPTLDEYLSFIQAKERELNKRIGVYVETKHPSYYKSIGLPLEKLLVDALHNRGYKSADDMVFIESFESNLKEIRTMTNIPLIQLISGTEGDRVQYDTGRKWKSIASEEGLREVATYAQGVGPHKTVLFKLDDNGTPVQTPFLKNAHDLGLFIHVWTFRMEREHFEKHENKLFGTIEEELEVFFNAGIDGVFTDQPDIGVRIKDEMFSESTALEMFTTVTFSLFSAIGLFKISKILRLDKMNDELAKTIQSIGKDELSNSH